jgi:Trypsin-like peptidase domain
MRVFIAAVAASVSNIVFQMTVDAGYLRNLAWIIPWGWGLAAALWTAWGLSHDKIAKQWLKTIHDKLGRGIHPIRAIICILVFFAVSLGFRRIFHTSADGTVNAQAQPSNPPAAGHLSQQPQPEPKRTQKQQNDSQSQSQSSRGIGNTQQQQKNSGGNNTQQQSSGSNSPNITQIGPCNVAQTGSNNTATVNCAPPSGTELAKFGAGTAVQLVTDADSSPHSSFNAIATGFWLNNKGYIATCLHSLHGHDIGAFVPMPPLLGQNLTVAAGGMTTGVEPIVLDKETDVAILHVVQSPFERSMHGFAGVQKLDDQGHNVGAPEVTQEQYWVPAIASDLAQSGDEIIRVAFIQQHEMPVVSYDFGHITRMGVDSALANTNKSYRIYTSIPFKDSNCGAPIINNAKTVIGMVHGSDGTSSVAIPSSYVLDVLKTIGN